MQPLFNTFSVKLVYLLLYLPNLNPIEEFFWRAKDLYLVGVVFLAKIPRNL